MCCGEQSNRATFFSVAQGMATRDEQMSGNVYAHRHIATIVPADDNFPFQVQDEDGRCYHVDAPLVKSIKFEEIRGGAKEAPARTGRKLSRPLNCQVMLAFGASNGRQTPS